MIGTASFQLKLIQLNGRIAAQKVQSAEAEEENGTFPLSQFMNVAEEVITIVPTEFSLSQNYPNPFNPSTMFSYSLPEACEVTLTIYDIMGKNVATVVKELKHAGYYTAQWMPISLSSGSYIARFRAGNFEKTIKLQFLK